MDSFEQFEAENFPRITPPESLSMPGKHRLHKRLVTEDTPMVLSPDLSVSFPNKSALKRIPQQDGMLRQIWPWMAVAAGVAAIVWFAAPPDGTIAAEKSPLTASISEASEPSPVLLPTEESRNEVIPESPAITSIQLPSVFQAAEIYSLEIPPRSNDREPSRVATSPLNPQPAELIAAASLPRELLFNAPIQNAFELSSAADIASAKPFSLETSETSAVVTFLREQPIGEAVRFVKSLSDRWSEAKALPAKGEALAVAQLQKWEDQIQSHLPDRSELGQIWSEKFNPKKKFARKRNKKGA
jgi:hypothetical protein